MSSTTASGSRLNVKAIVVGVVGGVISVGASVILPGDLPFQAGDIVLMPMLGVAGAVGGAIGGAISGVASPIFFIAVPVSIVGGALLGWGYGRYVWSQASLGGRLVAWAVLILVVDVISSLAFGLILPMLDPSMPGFPDSLSVMLGYAVPSTAFDVVATTVVMAVLPENLRRPLT